MQLNNLFWRNVLR